MDPSELANAVALWREGQFVDAGLVLERTLGTGPVSEWACRVVVALPAPRALSAVIASIESGSAQRDAAALFGVVRRHALQNPGDSVAHIESALKAVANASLGEARFDEHQFARFLDALGVLVRDCANTDVWAVFWKERPKQGFAWPSLE